MNLEEKLAGLNEKSSLKDLQEYVNQMVETRGFQEETTQDLLLLLTEELGELAKAIRKTSHIKNDVAKTDDMDVEGEIADIFLYLLAMCRVLEVDLLQAVKDKEAINNQRIWR